MFGLGMRLVPRRHRFGLTVHLADLLRSPTRWLALHRRLGSFRWNSDRDVALYLLLNSITKNGTTFDLVLNVEGEELVDEALASRRGVLFVAPHAHLSLLIFRYLYDRGHSPVILAKHSSYAVIGTRAKVATVKPSPTALIRFRSALRAGGTACAMIDQTQPKGKRSVEFEVSGTRTAVSTAILRLAVKCNAHVLFIVGGTDGRQVRLSFGSPRTTSTGSADAIANDFVHFVRARTDPMGA